VPHTEIELKLRIAPRDIARLRRHPLLASAKPQRRKVSSVYYDTPTFNLKEQGIALRLRRMGRSWYQTIKNDGQVSAGLHQRNEWENRLSRNSLNLDILDDPALREMFAAQGLRQSLAPVFSTEFFRTTYALEFPNQDRVEMAIDRGRILCSGEQEPISEVELELKAGHSARLFEFALELHSLAKVLLESLSKAQRGYALCAHLPAPILKAVPPQLDKTMTTGEAFSTIVFACLSHLQGNEHAVLEDTNPEGVHQMRVAIRRLRSALGLFSKIIPRASFESFAERLRDLGLTLGRIRDWDVFTTHTLAALSRDLGEETVSDIGLSARTLRTACRDRTQQALSAPGYTELLLSMGLWLKREDWRKPPTQIDGNALAGPVTEFAAQQLKRRHRRLLKTASNPSALNDEERHRVRIAAKKMRYAAEFLVPLYPAKAARRYIKSLAKLQEMLGELNDAVITRRLLDEVRQTSRDNLSELNLAQIRGWNAHRASQFMAKLGRAWAIFCDTPVFWKK
jgi:inorganic triphosphatase YgiF